MFTIVVFPPPVGPTIAIFSPGLTCKFKFSISGLSSVYEKQTSTKSTAPLTDTFPSGSISSISSPSRYSYTLLAEAIVDCIIDIPFAIDSRGPEKSLVYIINATSAPTFTFPFMTRYAPITQIATYDRLLISPTIGLTSPETK